MGRKNKGTKDLANAQLMKASRTEKNPLVHLPTYLLKPVFQNGTPIIMEHDRLKDRETTFFLFATAG